MRNRTLLCALFLLTALISSPLLHGQFQTPTKEELQMTADPKAPGAAAVYLYREETTDDTLHYHSYYERIKVLTENGKELATVRIPYGRRTTKVRGVAGRTIHPDGTVIPMTTKPADLVAVKTKDTQINTMVFTLPSVEVGSILEYKLDLQYDDDVVSSPTWDVQQPYFVHKAHYMFTPLHDGAHTITNSRGQTVGQLMYSVRAPAGNKVVADQRGRYTFDIADVPATPDSDWMPPLNTVKWRVEFYYTAFRTGEEFWKDEGKYWAKDTEKFASPTKALQDAASGLVGAGDTEEQKARKIYDAVMKLENTDFTRTKSSAERKTENLKQAKDAEDVWNQKSGASDDLALLYVALAQAAGLQAYPMQVVNRNRAIFDQNYLSLGQLDDYIAIVSIGGKEVFLDPGEKMCPFGEMHWKHALTGGLRMDAKSGNATFGIVPPLTYKEDVVNRVASLDMGADGSVTGTVRIVLSGQDALRWRQLALRNDAEEVKKQFNEWMRNGLPDGIQGDFDHFLGLDDYNSNLIATVKVTGAMGSATGKHYFLPGLFFESHAKHPFVTEKDRAIPVDVHYPMLEQDDVTYHLPAGYTVESLPQTTNLNWTDHALLKMAAASKDGSVRVMRAMAYNYTILSQSEYGALHDFYEKVATADEQQLVLGRGPAAKGN